MKKKQKEEIKNKKEKIKKKKRKCGKASCFPWLYITINFDTV